MCVSPTRHILLRFQLVAESEKDLALIWNGFVHARAQPSQGQVRAKLGPGQAAVFTISNFEHIVGME